MYLISLDNSILSLKVASYLPVFSHDLQALFGNGYGQLGYFSSYGIFNAL